ncbi:MAG: hypothetical protein R3E66_04920 [bacterium]
MTDLLHDLGEFQQHNHLLRTDPEISVLPDLRYDMDATADDLPVFGEPTLMDKQPDVSSMEHPVREFSGATHEMPAKPPPILCEWVILISCWHQ